MEFENRVAKPGIVLPTKSVLVVDDKRSFLKLTDRLFCGETRVALHTAQTSTEAFEKIKLNPDLVLMDLDLGDNEPTGIELVANFRKQGFKGIINMLTGNTDPRKLSEAFDAGANGYLVKCDATEGNLRNQVTRFLFPKDDSTGGGGRWP